MPLYIQRIRRKWYAVLDVPKDVRDAIGVSRYKQTLKTDSQSVAELRVRPVVTEWMKQIALARGADIGTDDELLATVMRVRRDTQRAKVDGHELAELQAAQEEVAMMEALGPNNDYSGDDTLFNAVSIAHGKTHLLREHIEEFLASRDVAPKTTDMQRRDLGLFADKFQYAHDATRLMVIDWVNVTLGAEQNLSLGTRSRMISAARVYWDYLEKNKGLTIPSPLHKILPPKPKKKTKAMIEAQRKAFRVSDYHKLLASCADDTLKDLITLAAYTGCRIEELCILKLENVSDDKVEIVDAKSEAGWRTIPIHHHIAQTVARLVATSADGYLLSGLTFNKYGNRSNAIGKSFGRLKKQVGYGESYVFHSFRKGFATQLENANIPVNVSARLMGHEVQGQTFGNYSDGLALKGLKEAISHVDWSLR